ncbi:hypothetical protein FRC01_002510, partial [Tulasnella sp. 417]
IRQQKKDKSLKSVSPSASARPRTPSWHCKDVDSELGGWQVLEFDRFDQLGIVRTIDDTESSPLYLATKSLSSLCSPSYDSSGSLSPSTIQEGRGCKEGQKGGVPSRVGRSRFSRALPPLPAETPLRSNPSGSLQVPVPVNRSPRTPPIGRAANESPKTPGSGSSSESTRRVAPRKPEWAVWDAYSATPVDVEEEGLAKLPTGARPFGSLPSAPPSYPATISGPSSPRSRASSVPSLSPRPQFREPRSRPPLAMSPPSSAVPSQLEKSAPIADVQPKASSRDTRAPRPTLEIADAPDDPKIARQIHIITRAPSIRPVAPIGTAGGAAWASSDATVISQFPSPANLSTGVQGVRRCASAAEMRATGAPTRQSGSTTSSPTSEGPGLDSPTDGETSKGLPPTPTRMSSCESMQDTRQQVTSPTQRQGNKRSGSVAPESDVDKLARGLQELSAIYSLSAPKVNNESSSSERGTLGIRQTPGRRRLSIRAVDSIAEESDHEEDTKATGASSLAPPPLSSIVRPISPLRINKTSLPSTIPESSETVASPSPLTRKRSASDPSLGSRLRRPFMVARSRFGSKAGVPSLAPQLEDAPQPTSSVMPSVAAKNESDAVQPSATDVEVPVVGRSEVSQSSPSATSQGRSDETHTTLPTSEVFSSDSHSDTKSTDPVEARPSDNSTQASAVEDTLEDDTSGESLTENITRPRFLSVSDPLPAFESIPIAWKGLPLEAAEEAYSAEQLQRIISQAIQASSENSSIRLLPPNVLERDLPEEVDRLELRRASIKARYNAQIRRRRVLLRSLPLYIDGTDPETAGRLIKQLEECTEACDKLSEELYQVTDQFGQLTEVTLRHDASALSLGMQRVNRSYKEVRGMKIGLQLDLTTLEAERDEAWALAEELEQKLKQCYQQGNQDAKPEFPSAWPGATLPFSVASARQASFRVRARMSGLSSQASGASSGFRSGSERGSAATLQAGKSSSRLETDSVLFEMLGIPQESDVGGAAPRVRALSDPVTAGARPQASSKAL